MKQGRKGNGAGKGRLAVVGVMGLAALFAVTACGSKFSPRSISEVGFLERTQTQSEGGVVVKTAVPSADEARALFGFSLYKRDIQPVWLEIHNGAASAITFFPVGLDPEYFTPIEAATSELQGNDRQTNALVNQFFFDRGMAANIEPGETATGFVFTRLDEGTKSFNVDVAGDDYHRFTFFVPVPGLKLDHEGYDEATLYSEEQFRDLSVEELIAELEGQVCCTTNKKSKGSGDPLNLVVIGSADDVYYSFLRAGWDETETIYRGSLWKTLGSFFSGGEYRYSPVSGLYVFGRPQDVAFQKARSNIHERNHLRLWLSPYRIDGQSVFLGQISRDVGVRFTKKTITTHKIDADVDETREFLLENLAYAQALAKVGYLGGVGAASIDAPRGNLTGDPYFTDGYRVVLWLASEPTDIHDIELLDWAQPPGR